MRRWLPLALLLACTPPTAVEPGESSTSDASTTTTTADPLTTTTVDPTTTTASTSPTCPIGQESCPCDAGACDDELACIFAVCVALDCTRGEDGCACQADATCGPDLECNSGGQCAHDGKCAWVGDGLCDAPQFCPEGSDVLDCCATPGDGVCEEASMGGACPDGTDGFDCGRCIYLDDGECDEPELCPPGTDTNDCCATPDDGVCEELGMGGDCPTGSDILDCKYCPTPEDGICDEVEEIGGLCPPGTDAVDCCAHLKDGVCEEIGMGGDCPPGADIWDCGYCPWADDDQCDEPEGTDLCGEGSDPKDCP